MDSPFRFSTRGLLVFTGWVAVVCVLLRMASEPVVIALFSATIALLFMAALNALHPQGPKRAFCLGFAACGVFYLVLVYVEDTHRLLVTSRLLGWIALEPDRTVIPWNSGNVSAFEAVGELIFTLLFAYVGGCWVRSWQRRERDTAAAAGRSE